MSRSRDELSFIDSGEQKLGQTRTETMSACSLLVSSSQLAVKLPAKLLVLTLQT